MGSESPWFLGTDNFVKEIEGLKFVQLPGGGPASSSRTSDMWLNLRRPEHVSQN